MKRRARREETPTSISKKRVPRRRRARLNMKNDQAPRDLKGSCPDKLDGHSLSKGLETVGPLCDEVPLDGGQDN